VSETEIILHGIQTLELAIAKCSDPKEALELWMRKYNLMECLYKVRYKYDILNSYT